MTKAHMKSNGFLIQGHANYAPSGYDIVCAAISTLSCTFMQCVTTAEYKVEDGLIDCTFNALTDREKHMYEYLITGLQMIAEQYPLYLEVKLCT